MLKKTFFRITSILLIITHLEVICLRDVAFAQEEAISQTAQEQPNIDFEAMGRIPDTVGHGEVPPAGDASSLAGGAATYPAFFQKDNHTPSNKFNNILETVSADLFTGKVQLSIPIFTPVGKRDMAPPVSISYSSGSGNNVVGVGWSLDINAICRSTKRGVPNYDSSDVFLAQGQELVNIGNNEYRNKIESSFIKYTFKDNTWTILDKSGIKYIFGSSDSSRITVSKGTFSWALEKIIDLKGNFLTISYIKEENLLYLSTILYTGNETTGLSAKYKVTFTYESRPDINLSYTIGELAKTVKRLKTVEVFFSNSLVRRYSFEYILSASTQRSLLSTVTEYGSDGKTTSPSITFTYRSNTGGWSGDQPKWHIPDGNFIKSSKDQGRRLYDLNGDGMFDFVISRYDPKESADRQWLRATYLNTGDGFSAKPNWWPVPLGYFIYDTWDDGRRLVDLTGDGIPELLAATLWDPYIYERGQYKNAYVFDYTNPQNPGWVQDTRWNLPNGYFVYGNRVDSGRRFADLNGDGLNDLSIAVDQIQWDYPPADVMPRVVTSYLNTGSGWKEDSRWNSPDGYYVTTSGDAGRRLCDINGDGLADFLVADGSYKATYLNTGSGWVRNDAFNISDGSFAEGGKDQGRMLVDINGDGLPDLVIARDGYKATYLNTGSGWRRDDSFNLPDGDVVDSEGKDLGRYFADLDGDGLIDICIAKDDYKKAYLNLAKPPDMLTKVSNGIGGDTTVEYTPSTTYNNYLPNTTGRLPFAVQLVSKISTSDGQGNSYATTYSYKDGYFDVAEREFRGFGYIKVTDGEGNFSENYFKQDSMFKGRAYKQETKDSSGKLYSRVENTWQQAQPYAGIYFVYLSQVDNYVYDADATSKHTRIKYEYDSYGNASKVISEGDVDITGDEKTQVTEYLYNTDNWLVSFPKHAYLLDQDKNRVSEKWFYYDDLAKNEDAPVKGLLTKEEAWFYNPLTKTEDHLSTNYGYDKSYGYPVSVTDARGNIAVTEYDTEVYSYPIRSTNALGHVITSTYDYKTGSVLTSTDPNNQVTINVYDALSRLIKVIGPNDTTDYPGAVYEYDLSARPIKFIKKIKSDNTSPPNYLTAYSFSDSLGRQIQTKSPAENDPQTGKKRQVVSNVGKFNKKGQITEKYLPVFADESSDYVTPDYNGFHSSFTYDAVGRLIQVANSDDTYATTSYSDWVVTVTDENGHYKTQYFDAYGRVIKVEEHNGTQTYTTKYAYDTSGNLIKVTDDKGNITQIWYDSLGRKIKMDDPDMGVWTYEYDKSGNLIKQVDANGQVLTFQYDVLNRLIQKQGRGSTNGANPVTLATYLYDDASKPNCLGRLSKVTDQSGLTEFFYDNLGREIKSTKSVDGSGAYTVERAYDVLDRLSALKYPDGEVVTYIYNPQGIESVNGLSAKGTVSYIQSINYSPTGQIIKTKYGNGAETTYAYDPKTLRLTNLVTESKSKKIQDLTYQFDKAGNIAELKDFCNTASQSFVYDDLNRLVKATGSYGAFTYEYNSIGNMTYKEGKALTYGKNGKLPHAVTNYNGTAIDYDSNGNMIKKGNLKLTYDNENRLSKVEDKSITSFTATVNLTLTPGWNFLSIPVILVDTKISSILSPIAGKYEQVSRYNPAAKTFEYYVGNAKYDKFNTFEYGKGYQIYITGSESVNLALTGKIPLTEQPVLLKTGHNLIFTPRSIDTEVETALLPLKLGVDYSKVFRYNKSDNKFQEYSTGKKEFNSLKPGEAYYLYCSKDTIWKVLNPSLSTNFVYDGDGGRVKKSTSFGATTYIGSLFEKESNGTITKHIFAGPNRVCIKSLRGGAVAEAISYFHSDHLGSSNVTTDATGAQTCLTEFTPYGSTFKQTGSFDPKHKFTGKELDASTGLYFYGARYYDPEIGHFTQADTIIQSPTDPQSLNRYSYCLNNPINYIDPTGHFPFLPFLVFLLKAIFSFMIAHPFITGAIIGAFQGGINAGIQGSNVFQGIVTGGAIGWATGGINSIIPGGGTFSSNLLLNMGYHVLRGAAIGAVTGGTINMISGGSFAEGAKSGAITGGIMGVITGFTSSEQFANWQAGNGFRSNREYAFYKLERKVEMIRALSVNQKDTTLRAISRPLAKDSMGNPGSTTGPRHNAIISDDLPRGKWEMGPDPISRKIATTNTVENLSKWGTHITTENSIALSGDYIKSFDVKVNMEGVLEAMDFYDTQVAGKLGYVFNDHNSNNAVKSLIYAGGGDTSVGYHDPGFPDSP